MSSKEQTKIIEDASRDFKIDEDKSEAFMKIVQDKYDGDVHRALKRAIDYFLMYESRTSLKQVADKIEDIRDKISNIREMNNQLNSTLETINKKTEQIRNLQSNSQKPKD
jgi:methyl-accepting chemotaxis protein